MRRSQRSSQITAALQHRVDLHKKLDAWCDKQAKRDQELGQLLSELVALGEKPNELADLVGMSRKHVRQLIDDTTSSKDDAEAPEGVHPTPSQAGDEHHHDDHHE